MQESNIISYILKSIVLVFLLASCGSEDPKEKDAMKSDLENQFNAEDYELIDKDVHLALMKVSNLETDTIDFLKGGNSSDFPMSGFYGSEENLCWGGPSQSSIAFYISAIRGNSTASIRCRPFGNLKQEMKILLNGSVISTLRLSSNMKTYAVKLPGKYLRFGYNLMTFKYSHFGEPGGPDGRKLAVAFTSLKFEKAGGLKSRDSEKAISANALSNELIQLPNSIASFYRRLPKYAKLEIDYSMPSDIRGSVIIESEVGLITEQPLPRNKEAVELFFELPKPGYYKVSLYAEGENNESMLIWKKIDLFRARKIEPSKSQQKAPSNGFVKASRPNIFFYVVDTLRADHLGCYGYERETSPNIDTFAKENALYTNAFANSSWTKASAATILTGLYAKHHQTMHRNSHIPDDIVLLGQILQEEGYRTLSFITNGNISPTFGFDKGFDRVFYLNEKRDGQVHPRAREVNEKFFDYLKIMDEKVDEKPLFVLLWVIDPHNPYLPPLEYSSLFGIADYEPVDTSLGLLLKLRQGFSPNASQLGYITTRYDQEIAYTDAMFGEFINGLKDLKLYEDAFILFTSDHGEEFAEHEGWGHGLTLYNEQLRIPLIIKWHGIENKAHDVIVQHADVFPTITSIIGVDNPYHLDGEPISQLTEKERILYFEEQLDKRELYAQLKDERKSILNIRVQKNKPLFETYEFADVGDKENLCPFDVPVVSFRDLASFNELMEYPNNLLIQTQSDYKKANIPPELDKRLRELGYVK